MVSQAQMGEHFPIAQLTKCHHSGALASAIPERSFLCHSPKLDIEVGLLMIRVGRELRFLVVVGVVAVRVVAFLFRQCISFVQFSCVTQQQQPAAAIYLDSESVFQKWVNVQ